MQKSRCHIARTALKRNEEVAECSAQSSGQNKKHHDGSVNGNQREIHTRVEASALSPLAQDGFEEWKFMVGPSQLKAHDVGHEHGKHCHQYCRDEKLF